MAVSPSTRRVVRERAHRHCEYCHADERWQFVRFTIDHMVPQSAGGSDDADNLALACRNCNERRGNPSKDVIQRRIPLSHSLIHGARGGLNTSSGTQPDYALLGEHPLDGRRSSCSTSTMTDTRVRLCAFDSVM